MTVLLTHPALGCRGDRTSGARSRGAVANNALQNRWRVVCGGL